MGDAMRDMKGVILRINLIEYSVYAIMLYRLHIMRGRGCTDI